MSSETQQSGAEDTSRKLNNSIRELQTLNKLALAISSTMDLDDIVDTILQSAIELTRANQGSIMLTKDDREEIFTTLIRQGDAKEKGAAHTICMNLAGWIFRNHESLLLEDVVSDARFKGLGHLDYPIQSAIAVPIQLRGQILGVLINHNKRGEKPFRENDLRLLNIVASQSAHVLENARLLHQLKEENKYLKKEIGNRFQFSEIIGRSAEMQRVFKLLEKVIPTDARVLIQGQSGTGKELIARAIHYNGPRRNKPFMAIDCGALPENLLESELFGHVKGAFTGATETKKGLFRAADGGTLFLDEINNTSQALQTKLLRAIQESEVRPVGGTHLVQVDVRIICATSQDLSQAVKNGTFREELYFRLKVVTIHLPRLRNRKEDIPILAAHFLSKYAKAHKKALQTFDKEAMERFVHHDWPGNIRELEHAVERCVVLAEPDKKVVDPDLLPEEMREVSLTARCLSSGNIDNLPQAVESLERTLIVQALQKFDGNRTRAAQSLGLSRRGLLNKIERYGLNT